MGFTECCREPEATRKRPLTNRVEMPTSKKIGTLKTYAERVAYFKNSFGDLIK